MAARPMAVNARKRGDVAASLRSARSKFQPSPGWSDFGAGEGNRTLVVSLEGFCSTIELHPLAPARTVPMPVPPASAASIAIMRTERVRPSKRLNRLMPTKETIDGGASDLARANPARPGVDPGRDLSGDQERARRSRSTRSTSRRASGSNMRRSCPGIGPVDRDEIVKGYEVSKGHYVLLDPEEIESVKLESRKTLDLVQFVDDDDIDPMYFDKPYYVVPADDLAEEAFVVLRDALRAREQDRHRPARDARAGICRRAEAVRPRHADRDAALCRRGQQGAPAISATSATTSPIPICSTWPRC